jgi:CHAT domain-containing protein
MGASKPLAAVAHLSRRSTPTTEDLAQRAAATEPLPSVGSARDLRLDRLRGTSDASFLAAALLARHAASADTSELLDAAEILAALGRRDAAARCNRVRASALLGLRYRVRELLATCPCTCAEVRIAADPTLDGKPHSADVLPLRDRALADRLVGGGRLDDAVRLLRRRSQAWRHYFERHALSEWASQRQSTPTRRGLESRLLALATVYERASGNPSPRRLYEQIAALSGPQVLAVADAIPIWLQGTQSLKDFRPDQAAKQLTAARRTFAETVPEMLPLIDLALATSKFHLGDDRAMREEAAEVRANNPPAVAPWIWARALWLEAVALQGAADWEESLRFAEESGALYARLGEEANAGYLDSVQAYALESMRDDREAERKYLRAVERISRSGDTRLLAGALWLFARQQGRRGRSAVAVELQRESATLDGAEGSPQLVSEAQAVLAEQLLSAGRYAAAESALRRAREALQRIESDRPRQRATAILAHVEALSHANSPAEAAAALTEFLTKFESFGERFYRAEALLRRARARVALGQVADAENDLLAAIDEIRAQSANVKDRTRAVALLDLAREALEDLVPLLLSSDPSGGRALVWAERLREDQLLRGLGATTTVDRSSGRNVLSTRECATEYLALHDELLSWTRRGGDPPELRRAQVERRRLHDSLAGFRRAAMTGDLVSLRRHSASASAWLIQPHQDLLHGCTSWTVIPDATFGAVPYAWLRRENQFLFARLSVTVADSLAGGTVAAASAPPTWRVAAFVDPEPSRQDQSLPRLRHAAEEGRAIESLFPGARVNTDSAASWTSFARAAGDANLLHFAGHVSPSSRVPLSARLLFAPESGREDGRVAADEIVSHDFAGVDLVVLAGCSSGNEAPTRVAGSMDFSRAFARAGVDRVLSTLWDVPDREIAAVIGDFMSKLAGGVTPDEAFRQTLVDQAHRAAGSRAVGALTSLQMTRALGREEGG